MGHFLTIHCQGANYFCPDIRIVYYQLYKSIYRIYVIIIMIIFIDKKDALRILRILADNKQQSLILRMPVGSYKKLLFD